MNPRKFITQQIPLILDLTEDLLPAQNIADARDLFKHGEWSESLYLICTQLYEYEIAITPSLYPGLFTSNVS